MDHISARLQPCFFFFTGYGAQSLIFFFLPRDPALAIQRDARFALQPAQYPVGLCPRRDDRPVVPNDLSRFSLPLPLTSDTFGRAPFSASHRVVLFSLLFIPGARVFFPWFFGRDLEADRSILAFRFLVGKL